MRWYFPEQLPCEVDNEVTQRDQFSNDEFDLSQTIVREAIQNSLDAAQDDPPNVTVSFRWVDLSSESRAKFLNDILKEQLEHARAAKLNLDDVNLEKPVALLIEDFGTKGLTGSVSEKTDDHFTDFWRRHGKSNKKGGSRGRWGLGKLVYSSTSQIGAFFGATKREGDPDVQIMGQTVLNLRSINGFHYKPHAFFGEVEYEGDLRREISVPIKDRVLANEFLENFFLEKRNASSGLSVIIPFPNPAFNRDDMIGVAIENYFYPVVTGQLILKFNDVTIEKNNIRELAIQYAENRISDVEELFDFIEEFDSLDVKNLHTLQQNWFSDRRLDEDDFEEDALDRLRQKFFDGDLLGFKFPVEIKKKDGTTQDTHFCAYIKKPANLEKGMDLYVRRGLTLPGECKFRERKALGAVIAEEEEICTFLGYAENPAHTLWIGSSEKLRANYQAPEKITAAIKKSLVQLYDVLACVLEEEDDLALLDYFWGEEPESTKKRKKRKRTPIPVVDLPPPRIQDFIISKSSGGFIVSTSNKTTEERFPQIVNIEVAYDVARGNPFNSYKSMDFTMGKNGTVELTATRTGKALYVRENKIKLQVDRIPFALTAAGFDPHRDLKVRLVKEASGNAEDI
tara:strand:+ start:5234 stop:7105 length:1872 start_codon:yes stop_codon:yes gene_type:complete